MTDPLLQDPSETDEAQAATKAAVFNAAERLFALHGFQNVSVRDITAEAGVNLASVNYHFGSKDALLFEIFRRRTSELPEKGEVGVEEPDWKKRRTGMGPDSFLCVTCLDRWSSVARRRGGIAIS